VLDEEGRGGSPSEQEENTSIEIIIRKVKWIGFNFLLRSSSSTLFFQDQIDVKRI